MTKQEWSQLSVEEKAHVLQPMLQNLVMLKKERKLALKEKSCFNKQHLIVELEKRILTYLSLDE